MTIIWREIYANTDSATPPDSYEEVRIEGQRAEIAENGDVHIIIEWSYVPS
jgi:hypothetical protein